MDKNQENQTQNPTTKQPKTRSGSGYLKQLYSTARVTANTTSSNLNKLTTFLVNFIPVEAVDASELQVRIAFDDQEIEGLAHSVKQHGVLQPILVVQNGDRYKVIAGERRLRASKMAGLERIPARVISSDDKSVHEIALRENLDRVDLHPIEEGEAYVSLLDANAYNSHDAIAKGFHKPKSRITECIGFTKLPAQTKQILLDQNLKNRALLRELLQAPEKDHAEIIEFAKNREEEIQMKRKGSSKKKTTETSSTSSFKSFVYQFNDRNLKVPSFSWKTTEELGKLEDYLSTMKLLVLDLEEKIETIKKA